ncbi:uncharacterized protein PF3D7_1120600 isoform X15 [Hydra vulgaris]|uniref:Uncharacterized protein PF3D7_1120600 isoform X15 n=1 Tax=Hydra vulgaris TaxID=6087 RepID=A0ABM4DH16_HYDVU
MATNAEHKTIAINVYKKTVKVKSKKDNDEYLRAELKDGKYQLPWKTDAAPPDGWANFKSFLFPDSSGVPNEEKLNEEPLMQLIKADPQQIKNPPENGIRVTWLGHASVLFQLDSANLLVNPNFNARGIKYYHPGDNKRYRQPVYSVEQLPRIDCVFITNTHFDYLDLSSVRQLNNRFGKMLLWYVPMGVCDWMKKAGCINVVEMDWWKKDQIEFIDSTIIDKDDETKTTVFTIACTPSQSYHNRAFDDDNAVLWCSWVICSPRYKIFVSGSTGYAKVFQSIGRKYGPFHMAALPIGGYDPKSRNGYGNLTPEQAVQVHKDILAMHSLALSWGTFALSSEHYLEPPHRLNKELKKSGLSNTQFFVLKHGESRLIIINTLSKEDASGYIKEKKKETELNGESLNNVVKETQQEDHGCDCCNLHTKELLTEVPVTIACTSEIFSESSVQENKTEEKIETEENQTLGNNVVNETQKEEHPNDQNHNYPLTEDPSTVICNSELFAKTNIKENKTEKVIKTKQHQTSINSAVNETQKEEHLYEQKHGIKIKNLSAGDPVTCTSEVLIEIGIKKDKTEEIEINQHQESVNNTVNETIEKITNNGHKKNIHIDHLIAEKTMRITYTDMFSEYDIIEEKMEESIETNQNEMQQKQHNERIPLAENPTTVTYRSEVFLESSTKEDKTEDNIESVKNQSSVDINVEQIQQEESHDEHKHDTKIKVTLKEEPVVVASTSEEDNIESKKDDSSVDNSVKETQQEEGHDERKHTEVVNTLKEEPVIVASSIEVFSESYIDNKTEDNIESEKDDSSVDNSVKETQQSEGHDEHKQTEIVNTLKEEPVIVACSIKEDNIESEKDNSSVDNSVKETLQVEGHDEHKQTEVVNTLKEEPMVVASSIEVFSESYIDNKTEDNIESEKDDSSVDNSVKETLQVEGHDEYKQTEIVNTLKEEPVVVASSIEVFSERYIDNKTEDNIESEKDDSSVDNSVKETQQVEGHDEHKQTEIVNTLKEEPVVVASPIEVFSESYIDNKTEDNIESEKDDSSVDNSVKETQQVEGHDEHKQTEVVNTLKEEPMVVASSIEVFSESYIDNKTEDNIESEKDDSSVDNSVKETQQVEGHDEHKQTEIVNTLKEEPVVVASPIEVFSESYIDNKTEDNIESEKDDSSVDNSVKETQQVEGHDEHKQTEVVNTLKEEPMVVASSLEVFSESYIDNKTEDNIESEKDDSSVDNSVKETQQVEGHDEHKQTEIVNTLKEEPVVVASPIEVFSESYIDNKTEDNIESEKDDSSVDNSVKETQQVEGHDEHKQTEVVNTLKEEPMVVASSIEVFSESYIDNKTEDNIESEKDDSSVDNSVKETQQVEGHDEHKQTEIVNTLKEEPVVVASSIEVFSESYIDNKTEDNIESEKDDSSVDNSVKEAQQVEGHDEHKQTEIVNTLKEEPVVVASSIEVFSESYIDNKPEDNIESEKDGVKEAHQEGGHDEHKHTEVVNILKEEPVIVASIIEVFSEINIKVKIEDNIESEKDNSSIDNSVKETQQEEWHDEHKHDTEINKKMKKEPVVVASTSEVFSESNNESKTVKFLFKDNVKSEKDQSSVDNNVKETQQEEHHIEHNNDLEIENTLKEEPVVVSSTSEVFSEGNNKEKTQDNIESEKDQSSVDNNVKETQQEEHHHEHKHDIEIKNTLKEEPVVITSTNEVFSESNIDDKTEDNTESEKDQSSVDNNVKERQDEKQYAEHKQDTEINTLKKDAVMVASSTELILENNIADKAESEKDQSSVDVVKETQQEEGHDELKRDIEEPVVVACTSEVFSESNIEDKTEDNIESGKDQSSVDINVKEKQQEEHHNGHKHDTEIENTLKEEPVMVASTSEVFLESNNEDKTESQKDLLSVDINVKETLQEEQHGEHKHDTEIINTLKEEPVVVGSTSQEDITESEKDQSVDTNVKKTQQEERHDELKHYTEMEITLKEEHVLVASTSEESGKDQSSVEINVKETQQEERHDELKHDTEIEEPVLAVSTNDVFSESNIDDKTEFEKVQSSGDNNVKETKQEELHDEHKHDTEIENTLKEETVVAVSINEMFSESNIGDKTESEKDQSSHDNNAKEIQQKECHDEHKHYTEIENTLKDEPVVITSTSEVFSESNIEVKIENSIESGKDQSSVEMNVKETQQEEKHDELKHDTEIEKPVLVASTNDVFSESNIDNKPEFEKGQSSVDNNVKETKQEELHDEHKHDTEIENTVKEETMVAVSTSEMFSESNIDCKTHYGKDQLLIGDNVKETQQEERHDEHKHDMEIENILKEETVVVASTIEVFSESNNEVKLEDNIESEKDQSSVDNNVKETQQEEHHHEHKHDIEINNTLKEEPVVITSTNEVFSESNIEVKIEDNIESGKDQSLVNSIIKETLQVECGDKHNTEIENSWKEEPIMVNCASDFVTENKDRSKTENNIESAKSQSSVDKIVTETQQKEAHDENKHETKTEHLLTEEPVIVTCTSEVFSECNNEDKTEKPVAPINHQSSVDCINNENQEEVDHNEHKQDTKAENASSEPVPVVCSSEVKKHSENNEENKVEDSVELGKDQSSLNIIKEVQQEKRYDESKDETETEHPLNKAPDEKIEFKQHKALVDNIVYQTKEHEHFDEHKNDIKVEHASIKDPVSASYNSEVFSVSASYNSEEVIVTKDQRSVNGLVEQYQHTEHHYDDRSNDVHHVCNPLLMNDSKPYCDESLTCTTEFCKNDEKEDKRGKKIDTELHHESVDTLVEATLREISP